MNRLASIAALAALGFTATAISDELESRVTANNGWVAYHVPMVADVAGPCCYAFNEGSVTRKDCDLDRRTWSFGTGSDDPAAGDHGTLAVYLRVEQGRIGRVHAVGASCTVRTASTVRWIDPVDPANSVAMLSSLLDRNTAGDPDDRGLVALAYHAEPSATRALATRAEPSHSRSDRKHALFWLGQARGTEGAEIVEHYATTDAEPKIRSHAVFALSQSRVPDAYAHILSIARTDPVEDVRSKALFWLAQMDDARAKDDIIASLNSDSSQTVRKEAVFALSQLQDDAADDALIAVMRGDYPREVKKQALFWLGQSGSPRAMAYFDEALK